MGQNGKGDSRRPEDLEAYRRGHDRIFGRGETPSPASGTTLTPRPGS
jgi:hypothetical protein